jgi:hypothetical protein
MRIVELMFPVDGADQNVLVITDAPADCEDRQAYLGQDRIVAIWGSIPDALGKEVKRLVPLTLEWKAAPMNTPTYMLKDGRIIEKQ